MVAGDNLLPEMNAGVEWVIDALGCTPAALRDLALLRRLCLRVVADLGLTVVGEPLWHPFPDPGGVTGLLLLAESHLACHTYPEAGWASFNLYCCRPSASWPWREELRQQLGATQVEVRKVARGVAPLVPR